jgi:glucose-1-phosphate thymidylyltransferase
MKGILLAGGVGSRLYPLTQLGSKHLQAVYDQPMVYYPLTTLIQVGIRDICLISTPSDVPRFEQLLGNGARFGVHIEYREQPRPEGIAQAFPIAESFIAGQPVCLVLSDNIFPDLTHLAPAFAEFQTGATVFAGRVSEPSRYGVVDFDARGKVLSLEEKPVSPRSPYAVPGLYLYDDQVVKFARSLQPSARGELEITDLNRCYLEAGQLRAIRLPDDVPWFDAGTAESLYQASHCVRNLRLAGSIATGGPEAASFRRGFLSSSELSRILRTMPPCDYRSALERLLE